jgi:hypothetical protein
MLTELSRRDWPRFFERMSAALAGRMVTVYGAGLDGAQEEEWVSLGSLTYDADQGELRILLGRRAVARRPLRVYVHQEEDLLYSMELEEPGGRRDFLVLRHPLPIVGASA